MEGGKLKHGSDTLFLATKLKIATTSFRKLGWVSLCYKTWIWYVINCLTAARKRHKHLEKQQNKTKHTRARETEPRVSAGSRVAFKVLWEKLVKMTSLPFSDRPISINSVKSAEYKAQLNFFNMPTEMFFWIVNYKFKCLLAYELLQMLFKNNQLDMDFLLYYSFYFRLFKNISHSITKKQEKNTVETSYKRVHCNFLFNISISYLIYQKEERDSGYYLNI